jgi:hypothetical protein
MTTPRDVSPDGHSSMAADLTPELALEIGGWDLRYAQVLVIAVDGAVGISVIDPNGDGNITETEHVYLDDTGRWRAGSNSGGGTSDRVGVHGLGWYPGVRYVYGRAEYPGPQTVSYRGRDFDVIARPNRWWAIAEAVGDDDADIANAVWAAP